MAQPASTGTFEVRTPAHRTGIAASIEQSTAENECPDMPSGYHTAALEEKPNKKRKASEDATRSYLNSPQTPESNSPPSTAPLPAVATHRVNANTCVELCLRYFRDHSGPHSSREIIQSVENYSASRPFRFEPQTIRKCLSVAGRRPDGTGSLFTQVPDHLYRLATEAERSQVKTMSNAGNNVIARKKTEANGTKESKRATKRQKVMSEENTVNSQPVARQAVAAQPILRLRPAVAAQATPAPILAPAEALLQRYNRVRTSATANAPQRNISPELYYFGTIGSIRLERQQAGDAFEGEQKQRDRQVAHMAPHNPFSLAQYHRGKQERHLLPLHNQQPLNARTKTSTL